MTVTQTEEDNPTINGSLGGSWADLGYGVDPVRGLDAEFGQEAERTRAQTVTFQGNGRGLQPTPPTTNKPKGIGLGQAISKLKLDTTKYRIFRELSLQAETKGDTEKTEEYKELVCGKMFRRSHRSR